MFGRWTAWMGIGTLILGGCQAADAGEQRGATTGTHDIWAAVGLPQDAAGGTDMSGPYLLAEGWPENVCGDGFQGGSVGGVWAESPDRVFVYQRGCLPVLGSGPGYGGGGAIVPERNAAGYDLSQSDPARHPRWDNVLVIFDRNGRKIDSWERHNDLFVRPHSVVINPYDPERHVWLVDDGAHAVYKFTPDGELVQTIGTPKVPGDGERHFNRPTMIDWLPSGEFFVSDGYTNTRVVKFDADGNYLLEWGTPGDPTTEDDPPGAFNTVHGVAIDDNREVYVVDRANRRIQVFDENGNFLRMWKTSFAYSIFISDDQHVWTGDGQTNKLYKYDRNGKLLWSFGTFGTRPGGMWGPHQLSVDSESNLYIADVHVGRVQKFEPKAGVNPYLLVGVPRPNVGTVAN